MTTNNKTRNKYWIAQEINFSVKKFKGEKAKIGDK